MIAAIADAIRAAVRHGLIGVACFLVLVIAATVGEEIHDPGYDTVLMWGDQ